MVTKVWKLWKFENLRWQNIQKLKIYARNEKENKLKIKRLRDLKIFKSILFKESELTNGTTSEEITIVSENIRDIKKILKGIKQSTSNRFTNIAV